MSHSKIVDFFEISRIFSIFFSEWSLQMSYFCCKWFCCKCPIFAANDLNLAETGFLQMTIHLAKNVNIRFWSEMRGRDKNLITFSSSTRSVYPVVVFWAIIFLAVTLFFSLLPVSRTTSATRDLWNPDHFIV